MPSPQPIEDKSVSNNNNNMCHAYITGYEYDSVSTKSEYPKPLSCDSEFGVWRTHAVYKKSSCCSDDGIYFVETGQSGGFDFGYENADNNPWCTFYAQEMAGLVCDPNQGKYVTDNTLKICESSCQLLFDYCGLPGANFPSWASYTNAISLCEQSWGGFSSSIDGMEEGGPCSSRPDGFACKSGIYKVEVVPDNGEEGDAYCLGFFDQSPTTQQFIDQYDPSYAEYTCDDGPNNTAIIIGSIVGCIVLAGLICFGLLVIRSKRNQKLIVEEQPITEHVVAATTTKQEQSGVVVEDVSTLHSSTSMQADSSIPIVVADSIVPKVEDEVKEAASAPHLENSNAASPENKSELTFHQRMNLREIEGNLQLGVITQQEFDSMRKHILADSHQ